MAPMTRPQRRAAQAKQCRLQKERERPQREQARAQWTSRAKGVTTCLSGHDHLGATSDPGLGPAELD